MRRREFNWTALLAAFATPVDGQTICPPACEGPHANVDSWRQQFPALAQRVHGRPLVYLDSAATTARPNAVVDTIADFYRHDNANPAAAMHELARRAHERYESARQTAADFLNGSSSSEIVWTRGTTEGINLVSSAWARPRLKPGDEILLTVAEHASNLLPWRLAAEATDARLRFVDVDEAGRISLEDLDRKLSDRTRLVSFSHVSNVAGYINAAAEICARARRAGARTFVDAAQSAPHVAIDVQAMGCDFLAFSSHKLLGPMGIGVLWARSELLEEMTPYQAGSNMAHAVDMDGQEFERGARKFGAGTPNVSGAIGLAAAIDFAKSLGHARIEQHEASLTAHALARLGEVPGLRLFGPRTPERRVPVFSFALPSCPSQDVLRRLNGDGIAIRAGDLSALPLLKQFGVTTAARASLYLYSTTNDIDRLVDGLLRIAGPDAGVRLGRTGIGVRGLA